jgi:hypothetical protein
VIAVRLLLRIEEAQARPVAPPTPNVVEALLMASASKRVSPSSAKASLMASTTNQEYQKDDMIMALMTNSTSKDFLFENNISFLVAVYSQDATFVRWMPGLVDIPLTTLEQPNVNGPRSTFDARTGMKSWLQSDLSPLQRFINNPLDITHTLSGGGLVTHSTINTFAFIRWTERFPIMISHIPLSIRRTGSISIEMPTVGTRIRVINRDGTMGSSEVRDLGIEMATNEKALFFILPNDINSYSTPDSGLVLVDNGAPLASYNPNPLWILICSVSPQDRSILWNPGRVNIPRPFQPGELRSYSFNSFNGNMSWIPLANRRQAIQILRAIHCPFYGFRSRPREDC